MTNNKNVPENALSALGFTEIEAAIYCKLLRGEPATGYRLAKAIGKAPANTYQALGSLTAKGAVMVEDGESKTYRAIPPADLLGSLQRSFESARHTAQSALEALQPAAADDRIYQLKSPAQIYERAEAMIARAREILLFDMFDAPLARLAPALRDAQARGVRVAGLVYSEVSDLPFAVAQMRTAQVVQRWPGQQLSVVVDASEFLVALLSHDGASARHGVWSDSVYLSCLQHSSMAAEIQLMALDQSFGGLSLLQSYPPGLGRLIGPLENQNK